jgi:hypothetical protein
MLLCPASESGGSAAAEASKYRRKGVCGDLEGRHVCGRYAGGLLVLVEGTELLYDCGGDGCERKGLQEPCRPTDVAGLQ